MNKKSQEEIVGFVVIMVVVAVVFLVFLGISIRQEKTDERAESAEVSQFLDSLLEITTECENRGFNLNVQNLIGLCAEGLRCSSTVHSCEVLKDVVKETIELSWDFRAGSSTTGYFFEAILEDGSSINNNFRAIAKSGGPIKRGASKTLLVKNGEKVTISLDIRIN